MAKCDICSKVQGASTSEWRTIRHSELKANPQLISHAIAMRLKANPDSLYSIGWNSIGVTLEDLAGGALPERARSFYLASVERQFGESDWLLCPDCSTLHRRGQSAAEKPSPSNETKPADKLPTTSTKTETSAESAQTEDEAEAPDMGVRVQYDWMSAALRLMIGLIVWGGGVLGVAVWLGFGTGFWIFFGIWTLIVGGIGAVAVGESLSLTDMSDLAEEGDLKLRKPKRPERSIACPSCGKWLLVDKRADVAKLMCPACDESLQDADAEEQAAQQVREKRVGELSANEWAARRRERKERNALGVLIGVPLGIVVLWGAGFGALSCSGAEGALYNWIFGLWTTILTFAAVMATGACMFAYYNTIDPPKHQADAKRREAWAGLLGGSLGIAFVWFGPILIVGFAGGTGTVAIVASSVWSLLCLLALAGLWMELRTAFVKAEEMLKNETPAAAHRELIQAVKKLRKSDERYRLDEDMLHCCAQLAGILPEDEEEPTFEERMDAAKKIHEAAKQKRVAPEVFKIFFLVATNPGDDDQLRLTALDILGECAGRDPGAFAPEIFKNFLLVATNSDEDDELRLRALGILSECARRDPGAFGTAHRAIYSGLSSHWTENAYDRDDKVGKAIMQTMRDIDPEQFKAMVKGLAVLYGREEELEAPVQAEEKVSAGTPARAHWAMMAVVHKMSRGMKALPGEDLDYRTDEEFVAQCGILAGQSEAARTGHLENETLPERLVRKDMARQVQARRKLAPHAVDIFVAIACNPKEWAALRKETLSILGDFGSTVSAKVTEIVKLLDDTDDDVRRAAAEALAKIDPDALKKAQAISVQASSVPVPLANKPNFGPAEKAAPPAAAMAGGMRALALLFDKDHWKKKDFFPKVALHAFMERTKLARLVPRARPTQISMGDTDRHIRNEAEEFCVQIESDSPEALAYVKQRFEGVPGLTVVDGPGAGSFVPFGWIDPSGQFRSNDFDPIYQILLKETAWNLPESKQDRIRFACPQCGKPVNAPPGAAGKKSRCPSCKGLIVVPLPAAEALPGPSGAGAIWDTVANFAGAPAVFNFQSDNETPPTAVGQAGARASAPGRAQKPSVGENVGKECPEPSRAVNALIAESLQDHLRRMKDYYIRGQGFSAMTAYWDQILESAVMSFCVNAIHELLGKSIATDSHQWTANRFGGAYIAVSTIPAVDPSAARAYFTGGYVAFLQELFNESDFGTGDVHLAHWIYCYDGDRNSAHLTFIPSLKTTKSLGPKGVHVFAQDLMTAVEKSEAGIG